MKFYKFLIISLFIILFSAGAVCAQDTNQSLSINEDTYEVLEITDMDVLSSDDNTFTDLFEDINDSDDSLNLSRDYKFNPDTDEKYIDGIFFENIKYELNGNYHVIDANGKSKIFEFVDSDIVVKNIIIKNSLNSAFRFNNCTVTTFNVTFINCSAQYMGGCVFAQNSIYKSYNDKFIDSYAEDGAAIFAYKCEAEIFDALFMSSSPIGWSLVKGDNSSIYVEDSVFANTTSEYATAIYNTGTTYAVNCGFINLFANKTAGAIGIKGGKYLLVQNCEFMNVSAFKDGGAIFFDNYIEGNRGTVLINRTVFSNCSADFGGACLQLGGYLNILFSKFSDNRANFNGGAVFASNSTVYVNEAIFENNKADFYDIGFNGGALYLDNGDGEIEHSDFICNSAYNGGAVYSYDNHYEISNSLFTNNTQNAIYSVFDDLNSFQKDNDFVNNNVSLDNVNFATYVDQEGKQIVLNPITVLGNASDDYFDLRDWGAVTPVKNQGSMGSCGAFGAAGAFESAFLKATGITIDISEDNVQNSLLKYSVYGKRSLSERGYVFSGLSYFLSWLGALPTEYDSYDELGKVSPVIFTEDSYHILDALIIPTLKSLSDIHLWKEALVNYGALTIFVSGANGGLAPYYNENTSAQYFNDGDGNHFVTLVGWNDTFSKDNFLITPPGDGAWICKNSWGSDWGDNGYFYVSYYDTSLFSQPSVAYIINNTVNYNKLYQLDVSGFDDFLSADSGSDIEFANTYYALDDDLISAVGTYFEDSCLDYTISVYVKDVEVYSQSGKSPYGGYHMHFRTGS